MVLKHQVNAFRDTDLKSLLDEHQVKAVTIVGSMSHMCIDAATRAAADHGYQVTVAHDACATLPLEFAGELVPAAQVHAASMAALAFAYAASRAPSNCSANTVPERSYHHIAHEPRGLAAVVAIGVPAIAGKHVELADLQAKLARFDQ